MGHGCFDWLLSAGSNIIFYWGIGMTEDRIKRMTIEASGVGSCDELTGDAIERLHNIAVAAERERICKAIKDEDDYCVTEGDYMLDSDDCIAVAKGEWVRPEFAVSAVAQPVQPAPVAVAGKKLQVKLQDSPMDVEIAQYKRMFEAACIGLGLINEALGLDPDDGGAEPILEAIAALKAVIAQPVQEPLLDHLKKGTYPADWLEFGEALKAAQPEQDASADINKAFAKITPLPWFVGAGGQGIGLGGNRWNRTGGFVDVGCEGVEKFGGSHFDNLRFLCLLANSWPTLAALAQPDHPEDSLDMVAQPTSGDYALGYAEGFNDACKKPAQEPVAIQVGRVYWDEDKLMAVPIAPPQRQPLTQEQRLDLLIEFAPSKSSWNAESILIDMVEAAHNIKEIK